MRRIMHNHSYSPKTFPEDFIFELNKAEEKSLRSQNVIFLIMRAAL
jgi:hypothetical protein